MDTVERARGFLSFVAAAARRIARGIFQRPRVKSRVSAAKWKRSSQFLLVSKGFSLSLSHSLLSFFVLSLSLSLSTLRSVDRWNGEREREISVGRGDGTWSIFLVRRTRLLHMQRLWPNGRGIDPRNCSSEARFTLCLRFSHSNVPPNNASFFGGMVSLSPCNSIEIFNVTRLRWIGSLLVLCVCASA